MNRTTSSPLAATAQLAIIMFVCPVWMIRRLMSPLLPIEAPDILLLGCMVAWAFLAKAILERDDALDPLKLGRGTPMWFAHRLVDQSLLGVGTIPTLVPAAAFATALVPPRELSPDELPPIDPKPKFGARQPGFETAGVQKAVPMLLAEENVEDVILATEEYIVGRGDTFWSVAEATLGDGRGWTKLQDLNLGREVAPGRALAEGDELRIGWSILVPVFVTDDGEHDAS